MPEFIKKNWGVILIGLALFGLVKFFWSEQAEQQVPSPAPQVKEVETEIPRQPVPSVRKEKRPPVNVNNDQVDVEEANEKPEEEPFELEENEPEPASQNYVLCEHIISGEAQYEFTGEIRLINKGTKPVYGWSVSWEYDDGSTIVQTSGVALSGNNPYTGQYLSENAEILPGKTVTFGFTGIKGGDSAPRGVNVTGDICM